MELKPGYKQTEVGVVPEDWDICHIRDLVRDGPKSGYSGRSGISGNGTPTLSLAATTSGQLVLNNKTVKHLAQTIPKESHLFLEPSDVLVQRSNTLDLVGTTAIFEGPPATYVYPDLMMRLRFKKRVTGRWFWRYANSYTGRLFFRRMAAGSTGSMPKISGEKLRWMPLPLPSFAEQEAIAEAMSDADGLIESLEQLLAKKGQLKQGAMQELLTGKKRLPGFREEWEEKRLSEVGTFLKGGGVSRGESLSGELPCVRYGEIYTRHNEYIKTFSSWVSSSVAKKATRLKYADILFAGSGETKEEIGKCVAFVGRFEAYAGGDIVILRTEKADPVFLGFYLNTAPINRQKASRGQGDAVVHIGANALGDVKCKLPSRAEQTAIAAILSDMDAEIAALEVKLAKARAIKQGMMQELLTGRIRLV